jgi:glyoxalase family protein
MKLEGIHHVTAITGDAQQNLDYYVGALGLRLVKKTVNQDDPTVYHLFYADEHGSAGSDITFFEYPGARPGRAGAGMVHTVRFRAGSEESLEFWRGRVGGEIADGVLRFTDPEGLGLELVVDSSGDEPLTAEHPEIPVEHRIRGFDSVRAFAFDPEQSADFLESALAFERVGPDTWEARGERRGGTIEYERDENAERGIGGAGTVHHVAWATTLEEHAEWRRRALAGGAEATPVIERFYFKSVYFREPSGVLFELATLGPGFAVDEPADALGERLSLPPAYEHLRDRLEPVLTPLRDPVRA